MTKIRQDIEENKQSYEENYGKLPENIQKKLEWFQDQKLGIIFHWGLYSIPGIVESWQLSKEDEWARKKPWRDNLTDLRSDYWNLNKEFNPTLFDPDEWAELCHDAGFKYMLFTTKHHDGFNMYDTKETDYKVTAEDCPYSKNPKADILDELTKAFRKEGIHTGAYYSKPDWHSPYYWRPGDDPKGRYASYDPKEEPEVWAEFEKFVTNQLVEISSQYGDIDILWLDGGWVGTENNEFLDMKEIARKIRKYQEDLLIVDRTIGGEFENYVTPERKIPEVAPKKVWESNIPLAKNWGYVPNDIYKPFSEVISSVVKIVAMGGNVILGVGPKPDGTLPEKALSIMAQLGEWLDTYGEGIFGTRSNDVWNVENWYFTKKEQFIYGFYENNKEEKTVHLDISDLELDKEIVKVTDMKSKQELSVSEGNITLNLSDEIVSGIKIKLQS